MIENQPGDVPELGEDIVPIDDDSLDFDEWVPGDED